MIKIKESTYADEAWNTRLIESNLATVYQSQEYALHHLHEGRTPHFLQFIDDKSIKAQLLVGTRKRFKENNVRSKILKNFPVLKQIYCYWTYGPIIFDKEYGELLGCHIIGHEATELIAELGIAKALETTWQDIAMTMHAHPTLSEAVMEAAQDAFGQSIHQ